MAPRTPRTRLLPALLAPCLLAGLAALAGCSANPKPTEFVNPRFDFGFVERVAVLPFENLSNDRQAGARATRLLITELLATGTLDVVEPGEVQAALGKFGTRVVQPSHEQIVALGEGLGVQALILGTVTQSDLARAGSAAVPVVALDVRMVEVETGTVVWAATASVKGDSFGARVLGTSGQPISETTRRAVRRVLRTLVQG
jgi:curli biogenesis system outer membrane secretion channel CsgG